MNRKMLLIPLALLAALIGISLTLEYEPQMAHAAQLADDHSDVETWDTCDGCHQEETPDEYQAWFRGKHGLNNVKCFVCHGSVDGGKFAIQPNTEGCFGCHGEKAESMNTPFMEGKTCFSCHPPHQLSPHVTAEKGAQP